MAKNKKALKYFTHGNESQMMQASAILLVLISVILLYLVATKNNVLGF